MWSAAALAPAFPVAVRQEGESYVRRAILRFVERERSHQRLHLRERRSVDSMSFVIG